MPAYVPAEVILYRYEGKLMEGLAMQVDQIKTATNEASGSSIAEAYSFRREL